MKIEINKINMQHSSDCTKKCLSLLICEKSKCAVSVKVQKRYCPSEIRGRSTRKTGGFLVW